MLFLPINLTVPLFNVARRPRPAPHFKPTMSKPVAPMWVNDAIVGHNGNPKGIRFYL